MNGTVAVGFDHMIVFCAVRHVRRVVGGFHGVTFCTVARMGLEIPTSRLRPLFLFAGFFVFIVSFWGNFLIDVFLSSLLFKMVMSGTRCSCTLASFLSVSLRLPWVLLVCSAA